MKNKIIEILEKQEKTFWTEPDDTQRYCVSINDEDIEKVADEIVATNDRTAIDTILGKILNKIDLETVPVGKTQMARSEVIKKFIINLSRADL